MKKIFFILLSVFIANFIWAVEGTGSCSIYPSTASIASDIRSLTFVFTAGDYSFSNGYVYITKPAEFTNFESRKITITTSNYANNLEIENITSSTMKIKVGYLKARTGNFTILWTDNISSSTTGKKYFGVYTQTSGSGGKRISSLPYVNIIAENTPTPTATPKIQITLTKTPYTCVMRQTPVVYVISATTDKEAGYLDIFVSAPAYMQLSNSNPTPVMTVISTICYYTYSWESFNNQTRTLTWTGIPQTDAPDAFNITFSSRTWYGLQQHIFHTQYICTPTGLPTAIASPTSTPQHTLSWVGIGDISPKVNYLYNTKFSVIYLTQGITGTETLISNGQNKKYTINSIYVVSNKTDLNGYIKINGYTNPTSYFFYDNIKNNYISLTNLSIKCDRGASIVCKYYTELSGVETKIYITYSEE